MYYHSSEAYLRRNFSYIMKSKSQIFSSIWIFPEALSQQKAPTVPSIWIALIKFIWAGERHLCTISFLVGRVRALSWDEIILVSSLYLMRDENRICARFSNFPPHWYCLYFIERWDCAFLYLRKTRFVQNFLPHCCCFCCQGKCTVRIRLFFFNLFYLMRNRNLWTTSFLIPKLADFMLGSFF